MNKQLQQKYREILLEVSDRTTERELLTKNINIDLWDILAAVFLAAFTTVAALGFGWIAYYIVISLSTTATFSSGVGIGLSSIDWLKEKENRSKASKKLKAFLESEFGQEVTNVSTESVKVLHAAIKKKLIEVFDGKSEKFEEFIKEKE